jgi:GTP-binding protein
LKIRTVEFVTSVASLQQDRPRDLPVVAFSGRSNVGKSSLINTLLRRTRSKIAKVSSQPGKTQTLNYYRVNDAFYLVDLPGFGYAKVPKTVRAQWKPLVEGFLGGEEQLAGVVHLIDVRHDPAPDDLQMIDYLAELGVPALLVFTKVDKLSGNQRGKRIPRLAQDIKADLDQIVPFSSKTGEGRDDLIASLADLLDLDEADAEPGTDG